MGSLSEPAIKISRPPGIRLLEYVCGSSFSLRAYRTIVLALTFFAYTLYHATRKPPSIVKSVLDPKTSKLTLSYWPASHFLGTHNDEQHKTGLEEGWAPFDGSDGTAKLGEIDVAFLSMYAIGMYFAGHLGDRFDLRIILTIGMVGTGVFTSLFGFGYWLNIHFFYYYLATQLFSGLFQSTGWPSVVAIVGNWCGKRKRGLVMGIWNAHTSFGNILGSLIAASLLKHGWGWSFVFPGILIALMGLIIFMFLPVSPESVGICRENGTKKAYDTSGTREEPLLEGGVEEVNEKAVGFMEAWKIPGVLPFAFCLFFCKLVAYTFLYWLPFYISHTTIDGEYLSDSAAGSLSTLFDVGGVVGGILAGHISDKLDARALTAATFMYCSIPAILFYRVYGSVSMFWNISLMLIAGMFVNGPYALITTAVSADLGTHISLRGSSRALATVTAIIDGTGSVGAAIGPLLTGYISANNWSLVFVMLMVAAFLAGLLLTRLVIAELSTKFRPRGGNPDAPDGISGPQVVVHEV